MAINFIIFIFNKTKLFVLPVFVVSVEVTSLLLILFLPILFIIFFMDCSNLFNNINIFSGENLPFNKENSFNWLNFFWFIAHPSVYSLILPGLGIVSHIIILNIGKNQFTDKFLVFNIRLIGFLCYICWFFNFISIDFNITSEFFIIFARLVTLIPIFCILTNWLFILFNSVVKINTPILFIFGYIATFF